MTHEMVKDQWCLVVGVMGNSWWGVVVGAKNLTPQGAAVWQVVVWPLPAEVPLEPLLDELDEMAASPNTARHNEESARSLLAGCIPENA